MSFREQKLLSLCRKPQKQVIKKGERRVARKMQYKKYSLKYTAAMATVYRNVMTQKTVKILVSSSIKKIIDYEMCMHNIEL